MTMNLLRMLENHGLMDMSRNSNFMDKSFMDSKNLMDSMAKSANLGNFVDLSKGGASGFVDLTKGYQPSRFDNDSLNWARTMLQAQAQMQAEAQAHQAQAHAHAQAQSVKSSAGHSMTSAHGQNGNSGGPPSMVSRIPDLPCTPNPNSYATSPTSLHNSQLVVPHPLKPMNKKKSYQCKMCDQKFDNKSAVYYHGKEAHGLQDKTHPCVHCYKSFSSPSQLHQHSLVHTGERKYHCKFCNKSFKQLSHLQQHTRIHTGEKPYKCTIPNCNKAFAQLSNLQHHQRNHDNNKAKSSRKSFYCTVCQRGFVTESSLDKHISRLHSHMSHHHSNALKSQACAFPGLPNFNLSSPPNREVLPGKLEPQHLMPQNHHPHHQGLFAHSLGLHNTGLGSPSHVPQRPLTASSMSSLEEQPGHIDIMGPLRSPHEPQDMSFIQRPQVFGSSHPNLPPISQVSNHMFPLTRAGIPAAAIAAGLRASLSSTFGNYGTHSMARSPLTGMSFHREPQSPGDSQ